MNDEIEALWRLVEAMPRSAARTALVERGVEIADADGDVEAGFYLRKELVEEAVFCGFPEKALNAFSWNLAQCDRDPEAYPDEQLLWQYKWIVHGLRHFPQIPRPQIEAALADLGVRFRRHGSSPRPVHKLRCELARHFGDEALLRTELALWKKSPRDQNSDCRACDQDSLAECQVFLGRDRAALKTAAAILEGRMRCAEVPHSTFPLLLLPLLRLGRPEEAAELFRRGYALNKDREDGVSEIGRCLLYLAAVKDFSRGLRMLQKQLPRCLAASSPLRRYDFLRGALVFLQALSVEPDAPTSRKLRLPEEHPLWSEGGQVDLTELQAWLRQEARALAQQFDARGGNDMRTREIDDPQPLERLLAPRTKPGATSQEDDDPGAEA